ncbi:MAG: HD-GYP domain-containing protein [Vulcanimicrobiaceae bacterium]
MELIGTTAIAKHLSRLRPAIVDRTMNRYLSSEMRTIRADLIVNCTIDRLLTWAADENRQGLYAFIDETAHDGKITRTDLQLFPSTVSAAVDELTDQDVLSPSERNELLALHRDVDVHVSKIRAEAHSTGLTPLDPVEAKIEQLVFRLSVQDTTTAEHSRAVSMWCSRIAKYLGFSRSETIFVTRGGLVHDVGKLMTPLEILAAPRSLTDEEWKIMQRHALDGASMVQEIAELRDFFPAVRWHHERYDGVGYPDRLVGSSIPLSARVVNVADAFNAMIARRPYRVSLSPAAAIAELKRHSGTQFDPVIVEALIDVVTHS